MTQKASDLKLNLHVCVCVSHPKTSGVQHFRIFREMHLNAAVLVERHGDFLQSLVPTVRTENFVHVGGRPDIKHSFHVAGVNNRICSSSKTLA